MQLSALEYDYVSISPFATIGTNLWFQRTGGEQYAIQIQDIIELRQGITERCLVTQYEDDSESPYSAAGNSLISVGNETTGFYLSTGTDIQQYVPYFIPDTQSVTVSSNIRYGRTNIARHFKNYAPGSRNRSREYDYSKRFILGMYDKLFVTDFTSPFEAYNGTYILGYWRGPVYFEYTDGNGHTIIYDKENTFLFDDLYANSFVKNFVPWIRLSASDEFSSEVQYPTITRGILLSSAIFDCPSWTETPYIGHPILNRVDTINGELMSIDSLLFGTVNIEGTLSNIACANSYDSMIGSPITYPQGIELDGTEPWYYSLYIRSFYIDPSLYGTGSYEKRADLTIDQNDWCSYVGSTNKVNLGTGLPTIGGFSDTVFSSQEYYDPFTEVYYTDYNRGLSGYLLNSNRLTERYKGLKYLESTLQAPFGNSWTASTTGDYMYSTKSATATTWSEAKSKFTSAPWITANSVVAPLSYITSYKSGDTYAIAAYHSKGVLHNYFNDQVASQACGYIKSSLPNSMYNLTNTISSFDAFGTDAIYDRFALFDTEASASKKKTWSSSLINPNKPTETDASQPFNEDTLYIKGFIVTDQDTQAYWDFQYCVT